MKTPSDRAVRIAQEARQTHDQSIAAALAHHHTRYTGDGTRTSQPDFEERRAEMTRALVAGDVRRVAPQGAASDNRALFGKSKAAGTGVQGRRFYGEDRTPPVVRPVSSPWKKYAIIGAVLVLLNIRRLLQVLEAVFGRS